MVWRDDGYGLIDWKQRNEFGHSFGVEFGNPDLVAYAESFGIAGFRPADAADLYPTLLRALAVDGPAVIDVPDRLPREPAADRAPRGSCLAALTGGRPASPTLRRR